MRERPVNLACTGIASFCKVPIVEDVDVLSADVAVLGIPWDEGSSFRPGCRLGPRDIRQYSVRYAFRQRGVQDAGYWDIDYRKRFLEGVKLVDTGDVDIIYTDLPRTFDLISESVSALLDRGVLPVLLGGDHSVTYPIVRAFSRFPRLDIVHLDAHLDYFDSVHGVQYANGNPLKRISELPFVGRMVQIGMRGLRAPESGYRDSLERGNVIVTAADLREQGVQAALDRIPALGPTYVTIDIDAMDPSLCPGTGSPEPDGLLHWQAKQLLRGVAARAKGQVVGLDLVEVNPLLDTIGQTSSIATLLLVEFLGAVFEQREGEKRP